MRRRLGLITILFYFIVGCTSSEPMIKETEQGKQVGLPATWTTEPSSISALSTIESTNLPASITPSPTPDFIPSTPTKSSYTYPTRPPLLFENFPDLQDGELIQITQIHMATPLTGWAIGYQDSHFHYILHTENAGISWQDRTPTIRVPIRDYTLTDEIFFYRYDENTAWVLFADTENAELNDFHIVWQTNNGGLTWIPSKPLNFPLGAPHISPGWLFFLDQNTGWLLVKTEMFQMHDWAFLFSTRDGGQTWDLVNQLGDSMIENLLNTGIQFANALDGWVTKDDLGIGTGPFLEQTHDGGYTWHDVLLPHPEGREWNETLQSCQTINPVFTSSNTGYVLVQCFLFDESGSRFLMDDPVTYIYASSDWGENWEIEILPTRADHLFFTDTQIGYAMGTDHYKTTNGGADWTKHKNVSWNGQFSFINANEGWVVARRSNQIALLHTIDGGKTYQEIKPIISK